MKLGEEGVSYLSLPPNMQSNENYALCIAFDHQMGKITEFGKRLLVWGDLDNLDPGFYDYAAATLRSLYYSSRYDDETKLQILKNALKTYRYAGSVTAIEDMLKSLFQDAAFVPWYEYDGEAYHFKIVTSVDPSEDSIKKFIEIFQKIKAKRSIFDAIETPTYRISIQGFGVSGLAMYEKLREEETE